MIKRIAAITFIFLCTAFGGNSRGDHFPKNLRFRQPIR